MTADDAADGPNARAGQRSRPRELGITLGRLPPGPLNSITDVAGVMVGHRTLVRGGPAGPASAPVVRTGVTAILPHPSNTFQRRPRAGHFIFNGYGKTTGLAQLGELGVLETPILLTNTLSVWTAANALVTQALEANPEIGRRGGTVNPVVGECSDSFLNDLRGRHVSEGDALAAIAGARGGLVDEGAVGAGTGMSCLGFKGGVGTSSRVVALDRDGRDEVPAAPGDADNLRFTTGVLVVTNFGRLDDFRLDGVPVGRELLAEGWPGRPGSPAPPGPPATAEEEGRDEPPGGSIMIVLATDAPLSSRQLTRVARRAALGLARTGSVGAHGSGDFVLAFSTAEPEPAHPDSATYRRLVLAENDRCFGPLFQAAVEATEEAIINSLFRAETTTGRDGHVRHALPIDRVVGILQRHGRL